MHGQFKEAFKRLCVVVHDAFCWRKSIRKYHAHDLQIIEKLNDQLTEAVVSTSDVSQRIIKKLESKVDYLRREVTEREELLSDVFSTIPDFLCLKDGEGRWKLLNTYGKKLYGIEGTSYKEKTDEEIAKEYPLFADSLIGCVKTDNETWKAGKPLQFEEKSFDAFGREHIFDVVKTPVFNEDGSRKHILIHGKNVTEELENTKHIRMLLTALNKASDSITVTDHNHNIIYVNEAFCKTYGYTHADVMDKRRNIVASGQTPKETYDEMYKAINKAQVWSGIMINKTKSGDLLREIVTITPVLNGKTYPIYYIGVNRLEERRREIRTE